MTATLQPRWQDLFTKLLQQSTLEPADAGSEVELYQAQPALGFDTALAWNEALLPALLLAESPLKLGSHQPGAWSSAHHVSIDGLFPCCIGLAPQFLQKIDSILNDAGSFFQRKQTERANTQSFEPTLDAKSPYAQLALARLMGDHAASARLDRGQSRRCSRSVEWAIGREPGGGVQSGYCSSGRW
jgi:hypothetical protein